MIVCLGLLPGLIRAQQVAHEIPFHKDRASGLLYVDATLNGVQKRFIFDTGASTISINADLYRTLVNAGKISSADVVGNVNVVIASGNSVPGKVLRLRTVQLGNVTLKNVEAIVMPVNDAPLLIGQSIFSQFETVAIDYKNSKIKLENPRQEDAEEVVALREVRFIPCSQAQTSESAIMANLIRAVVKVDDFTEEANVPPPAKAVDKLNPGVTVRYFDNEDYDRAAAIVAKLEASGRYQAVALENMLAFFNYQPISGYLEIWVK